MMQRHTSSPVFYEVEMAPGLEQVAFQGLRQQLGAAIHLVQPLETSVNSGCLRFSYQGDMQRLRQADTLFNAYLVLSYDIPRPKTLLAQQHFARLLGAIQQIMALSPQARYHTFGISAAGANSPVLQALREQLAAQLKLPFAAEEVDLLLRLRPARLQAAGWEVLIRLTPRPLSVRPWRVAEMKGALNAAVARSMVLLTQPQPTDKYLNLTCGSGTLLVERLLAAPARRVIGCDIDPEALQYAQANLVASKLQAAVELYGWDARALNLPDASMDAICADLPFGLAVGAHDTNVDLYPQLLREAARVAKQKSRFVLMTQEVTLMDETLNHAHEWKLIDCLKIILRGLHPRIYVLQRKGT